MDCAKLENRLPALVDGQLGAIAAWRLKRHLSHCPGCRNKLEAVKGVLEEVRGVRAPARGERFWENFNKQVVASLPPGPQPQTRRRPTLRLVPAFATAAAALLAVLVLRWPAEKGEWAPEDWESQELFTTAPWRDLPEDDLTVVLEEMQNDRTWSSDGRAALLAAEDATPWEALDLLDTAELEELLETLEREADTASA
jgi:anti-sigma factor RsiW